MWSKYLLFPTIMRPSFVTLKLEGYKNNIVLRKLLSLKHHTVISNDVYFS